MPLTTSPIGYVACAGASSRPKVSIISPIGYFAKRAGASSKIEPMRTPVRDVLLDSQEDAWVRVGDGWLTGRAQPESKEELMSWGADVVVSLQYASEGGEIAHGIVAAAVSARALAYHYVCPVHIPTWRSGCSDNDCTALARAVVAIDAHLQRGHKVVVHCKRGLRRTAMAIYMVLLSNVETHADCLPMMKTMRRAMHAKFVSRLEDLVVKAQCALSNPAFIREYAYALHMFCIELPPFIEL